MENKNKFWKGVMAGVFATAFVCLAAVAASVGIYMFGSQTLTRAQNSSGEASGEAASLDMEQVNQKLGVILDLINEVYLFDTDPSLEEAGLYKGLMYSLGDLYADYYTPEEMQAMQEQTTGEYCGIGAMISQDRMTNVATVTKVYKDSPAEGTAPGRRSLQGGRSGCDSHGSGYHCRAARAGGGKYLCLHDCIQKRRGSGAYHGPPPAGNPDRGVRNAG